MQKIVFLILALTFTYTWSCRAVCDGLKGFGQGFSGERCSSDFYNGCMTVEDALEQFNKILSGDTAALTLLIADGMKIYSLALSSAQTCQYEARLQILIDNVFKVYMILMQHFTELRIDVMCVIQSFSNEQYEKLGQCVGDALKILATKA